MTWQLQQNSSPGAILPCLEKRTTTWGQSSHALARAAVREEKCSLHGYYMEAKALRSHSPYTHSTLFFPYMRYFGACLRAGQGWVLQAHSISVEISTLHRMGVDCS